MTATIPPEAATEPDWHLDAFAPHWLPLDDLHAVIAWMDANGVEDASGAHPVIVHDGRVTYQQDRDGPFVHLRERKTTTVTVPLVIDPPVVYQPACDASALATLTAAFEEHEWSDGGGGSCATCSSTYVDDAGRTWTTREGVAPWPCMPMRMALAEAGVPLDPPHESQYPLTVLGDTLDPAVQAVAFGGCGQ